MKRHILFAACALSAASALHAGVGITVNIGQAPYYGYAPADVVYVERYVPVYDVPRVLFISRYAQVSPAVVVNLYRKGWGWDRVCNRYRVPVNAFYGPSGPPYGNAWGHHRYKHNKYNKKFKHRRFDD
jgi:hypothetical protein